MESGVGQCETTVVLGRTGAYGGGPLPRARQPSPRRNTEVLKLAQRTVKDVGDHARLAVDSAEHVPGSSNPTLS